MDGRAVMESVSDEVLLEMKREGWECVGRDKILE